MASVSSGCYIFLQTQEGFSDNEILGIFGFKDYQEYLPNYSSFTLDKYIGISRYDDWICLIDDWYYTIHNYRSPKRVIRGLRKTVDQVLYLCIGDTDDSFEVVLYQNSKLRRQIIRDEWNFSPGKFLSNRGRKLPFEDSWDISKGLLPFSEFCGFDPLRMDDNLLFYGKPHKPE